MEYKLKINLIGSCQHQTSYGSCTLNFTHALAELGHEVSLFPIGQVSVDQGQPWTHKNIVEALQRGKFSYDRGAPCIRLYHQFSQQEFVGHGPHIAFPIFELDKFTKTEQYQLQNVDHIIVCSEWAKSIVDWQIKLDPPIECNLVDYPYLDEEYDIPCSVVPLGYDPKIFYERPLTPGPTNFLLNGKIEVRKCTKEILDAFNQAFTPSDDVRLYLCWGNIFMSEKETNEWVRYAQSLQIAPRLSIVPRLDSIKQVSELLGSVDCVVSMSRAEGFNLGLLEALASSRHVIGTNNTAQTEFLDNSNAQLIETPEYVPAMDGRWFLGEGFEGEPGKWAKIGSPQIEDLIQYMRNIHERKQSGMLGLNIEGLETAKNFTWKHSAQKLVEVLENL